MTSIINWIRARLVGLWRSRTIRLSVYAAAIWAAGTYAANSGLFPANVFGQVDPILYQSAAFKMTFCIVAAVAMLNVLAAFDNSSGITFRTDVLPELVTGNLAMAVYFGARILAVAIVMGFALG